MAHALWGYDGECKNIHGHTYHLSITLLGTPIGNTDDVKLGMVIDFGDLKKIVREAIIEKFDHTLVLYDKAPYSKSPVFTIDFQRVIFMNVQPTCENLLLHFVEQLKDKFSEGTSLVSVRLDETPTSYAEWFASDN